MSEGKLIGRQFGKYELITLLGSGGMADVYSAYQPGPERMVAIKLMHGFLGTSSEAIARFKREARSVALLRHPNIVQLFDFDVEENIYYMVMEYIVGGTLAHHIYEHGALTAHDALNLTIQLADALQYAHSQGIIHRDIKPVNIMFADTEHQLPILTDFGIARIMNDPVLTSSARPIGSPAYLSPEVSRGKPADERTDIYSLGVTFYEMLTGRLPFEAEATQGVIHQHAHMSPPPLSQFNVAAAELMEALLQRMMAKRPENRFQSSGELKTALLRAQSILTRVTPTGPSYAAPKPKPSDLYPNRSQVNIREGVATPHLNGAASLERTKTRPPTNDQVSTGRVATAYLEPEAELTRLNQRHSRREVLFVPLLVITAFIFGMFLVLMINNNKLDSNLPLVATLTATQPAAVVQATLELTASPTISPTVLPTTLVPTATDTPTTTPSLTPTLEPTATVEVRPSTTPIPLIAATSTARSWPTQERRELTEVPLVTATPTRHATVAVIQTQAVQPTQPPVIQATSVPPTAVPPPQPTNPPPQPTSPPPQPTSPPIIPPIIPTVVAPLKTLLPGL